MSKAKALKQKKCKVCQNKFPCFNSLQKVCSPNCAVELVKQDNNKKFRKQTREMKERIKTKSDWLKEAQTEFNKYVRLRDGNLPCISCGRHHNGQYHAGHYLSVGACAELRFHPFNNNKQCAPCNNHLSGNAIKYRVRLIERLGLDAVEWLEGPHEAQKLTIDDIKEIKAFYKDKIKAIKLADDT